VKMKCLRLAAKSGLWMVSAALMSRQ
jgi:hypothetical protein